ncbi:hypothetical protein KCH_06910 [Kitasatospora cheerisanensis KCTC 2395]|uniref:Uncharacterized protein n=1 Tax=Kitasatospora cheerisanensis KCTC 2395 TaxID=1348663 RepID=A0A066ZB95_9ACTN|nr:hypothetical protein KCH_06910 [Kitasatospora cheerisanensis KCTC 2395]
MTEYGYFLSCEEYTPGRTAGAGTARGAVRLHQAGDLRPLPSVDGRAGQQPVRGGR